MGTKIVDKEIKVCRISYYVISCLGSHNFGSIFSFLIKVIYLVRIIAPLDDSERFPQNSEKLLDSVPKLRHLGVFTCVLSEILE